MNLFQLGLPPGLSLITLLGFLFHSAQFLSGFYSLLSPFTSSNFGPTSFPLSVPPLDRVFFFKPFRPVPKWVMFLAESAGD